MAAWVGMDCIASLYRFLDGKKKEKQNDIELGSSYTLSILRQLQSFYVEYQI
jgi:hypothetical protein